MIQYNYKKGIDLPSWHWLSPFTQGISYGGTSNAWDGVRYMYWIVQYGSTSSTASTTHLWRFDTWTNGWQYLATPTSGNAGMDIEYDPSRNILIMITGAGLNSWQVFNLNLTAVTVANISCPAWALTTITPVLPATANVGASITLPTDKDVIPQIDNAVASNTGNTTTTVVATDATGTFALGMQYLQLRVTSGTQNGQRRTIASITDKNTIVITPALGSALASGDTFIIEQVEDIATSGTTTALTDSTANWTVNAYANMDVLITGGTGIGQRRRIASNTSTALTLAAAVTGNANTGPFTVTPDATSTFRIIPSRDFLYYAPANGTAGLYRLDLSQTGAAPTWTTLASSPAGLGGGGNTFYPGAYAPYGIVAVRGAGTSTIYHYHIGTNTWVTYPSFWGSETITTGAACAMMHGKRKILIQKEGQGRCYAHDLPTGVLEPIGVMPYANPSLYDGKRARFVKTQDGVEWVYLLRAGGQEFYRVPIEWM